MSPVAAALVVVVALLCAAAYGAVMLPGKRGEPARDWISMHTRHRHRRHQPAEPEARPIEDVVAELRRAGLRFHGLGPHASYARSVAVRGAYDRLLAECCATLGVTHLLTVLPPGPELDAERTRVEAELAGSGVSLPYAA